MERNLFWCAYILKVSIYRHNESSSYEYMCVTPFWLFRSRISSASPLSLCRIYDHNLEADVLDLSGVALSDVLYYISGGYPVMAMTGQGSAVIITGYDSKNTILYDPKEDIQTWVERFKGIV